MCSTSHNKLNTKKKKNIFIRTSYIESQSYLLQPVYMICHPEQWRDRRYIFLEQLIAALNCLAGGVTKCSGTHYRKCRTIRKQIYDSSSP